MSGESPTVVREAQCPGCGATLRFTVGASRLVVCEYCSHAVVRTGRGIEQLGKVGDVVPTGAKLALGARGRYGGVGFVLAGRLQVEWAQGAWDEWYAAFDDGRWGWIAEAVGRYYVSFRVAHRPTPPFPALKPGRELFLHGLGRYVVSDIKEGRIVTARGELPSSFGMPSERVLSVDLSGGAGAFATLDFGPAGASGHGTEPPTIFAGREASLEALEIETGHLPPPRAERVAARGLTCPNCSAPVAVQSPDQAMRVTCHHCSSFIDASAIPFAVLGHLKKPRTQWELGRKGRFFGREYVVAGWLQRECRVEGETYAWEEYVLYDPASAAFRWLVCSEGHWSFVQPIAPGDVEVGVTRVTFRGETFRRFSAVTATVRSLYGEFPWAVKEGETNRVVDYVRAPEGLSEERDEHEVNWSHATYLQPEEVWAAFGSRVLPRLPRGVGAMQPYPHAGALRSMATWTPFSLLALVVLLVVLAIRAEERDVLDQPLDLRTRSAEQGGASSPWVHFSEPFEIPVSQRNLKVSLSSNVQEGWAFVSGALINEAAGEVREFGLESSYYSGRDSDGHWVENRREASTYLSSVPAGQWVLRSEAQWSNPAGAPLLRMQLTSGVVRTLHFVLAAAAILLVPFILLVHQGAFEARRWEESS